MEDATQASDIPEQNALIERRSEGEIVELEPGHILINQDGSMWITGSFTVVPEPGRVDRYPLPRIPDELAPIARNVRAAGLDPDRWGVKGDG